MKKGIMTLCHLLIISFYLIVMTSCSSPTESSKGSLAGTVTLEGETDHSGITIALYNLAYLDTTIVRINNQYPQIGVHINQHTEFDHRLQSPVKYTETSADGSFELTKISTGRYNLVAIKDGWGFKYLYDIEIGKGDNELNQQITLYEETIYSSEITGNAVTGDHIFLTDHHYLFEDNIDFVPYTSFLTIQPGAVIRINPGVDLTIYGSMSAQGEENNMFWVTSNDGFSQDFIYNTHNRDEIALYNYLELSPIASISNDLIEWGKWDYGTTCLLTHVNNLHIKNGIIRKAESGLSSTNVDSTFCEKLLVLNCYNESNGGVTYYNVASGLIGKSIFYNCQIGIVANQNSDIIINNNSILYCGIGIYSIWYSNPYITNNTFERCLTGIHVFRHSLPIIENNNITADIGVVYDYYNHSPEIHQNNINCSEYSIKLMYHLSTASINVNAQNNYFFTTNETIINTLIFDKNDVDEIYIPNCGEVIYNPFESEYIVGIGIQ